MSYLSRNKNIRTFILFVLLVGMFQRMHSQAPFPLKVNDVVDHSIQNVYDINQDKNGYIWTVTESGLNRFDGYEWKGYSHSQMSSKSGTSIQFDQSGRPWYNNFDGEFYYVENEQMHKASLPRNANVSFKIENDTLWMVNKSILMWYHISTQQSKNVMVLPRYRTIYFKDDYLQIYDAINQTIRTYDYEGVFLKEYLLDANDHPTLYQYKSNWYKVKVYENSIQLYQIIDGNEKLAFLLPIRSVVTLITQQDQYLLIGTKDGSIELDLENFRWNYWLEEDIVLSNFKDHKGNNWIGATSGLYYYSQAKKARVYKMPGIVYSFFNLGEFLFFVDEKGKVYEYDRQASHIYEVFQSPLQQRIYQMVEILHPQMKDEIIKSKRASLSNLFRYKGREYMVMNSGVKSVTTIDDKYLAVAMSGSCDLIKIKKDTVESKWDKIFQRHQTPSDVSNVANLMYQIRGKDVAYNSTDQQLFFSSNQGTKIFTPDYDKELIYNGGPVYADNIQIVGEHTFLLTNNGDLLYYNQEGMLQKLEHLSEHLPILGMLSKQEYLIFWNTQSIYYIHIPSFQPNITIQDIPHISCPITLDNIYDVYVGDDKIALLTGQYLLELNHNNASIKNDSIPTFNWHQVMTQKGYMDPSMPFVITSTEDDLKINFSIIDYDHEVFDLSYKVNDGEWKSMLPSERSIQFANIGAGDYTVSIRINGKIQSHKMKFVKLEPWYGQWWFYLLVAGFISSTIIFYFKYRINVQAQEGKLLLEKSDLEHNLRQSLLSSIKSQMNPHFLFNALNTIQSYIITEDKENASRYLSMYARLTRMILEMSDKEYVSLDAEIKTCNLYVELERMRFPDIQYKLKVNPIIQPHSSYIPSMIIQPFVENAIKHGLLHKRGEKRLEISMDIIDNDILLITIFDNGIGRKQSAIVNNRKNRNHQSFATQANIKRLELLNLDKNDIVWKYNDLEDENLQPLGTEVLLKIPLKYNIKNDTSHNSR